MLRVPLVIKAWLLPERLLKLLPEVSAILHLLPFSLLYTPELHLRFAETIDHPLHSSQEAHRDCRLVFVVHGIRVDVRAALAGRKLRRLGCIPLAVPLSLALAFACASILGPPLIVCS